MGRQEWGAKPHITSGISLSHSLFCPSHYRAPKLTLGPASVPCVPSTYPQSTQQTVPWPFTAWATVDSSLR